MNTIAKPTTTLSAHWYDKAGNPCHFVPKKDGTGTRPSTIADARKNGWLPSVTTIIKILDKPALTNWLIEQAVLAVVTSPRLPGEADDAFIERVLHTERQQDEEGKAARDLGTEIHDAVEAAYRGEIITGDMATYVNAVQQELTRFGTIQAIESVVVGPSYAGKLDLLFYGEFATVVDMKTTKKLPKSSWPEHRLQLAAYAAELQNNSRPIKTANCYISTTEPGKVVVHENPPWKEDYENGFIPMLKLWQWLNNYRP